MMLPHQLIIRETKSGVGGYSDRWKIVINPKYEHNEGIFAHEYEHLKQWYVMTILSVSVLLLFAIFVSAFALLLLPFTVWVRRLVYNNITSYRQYAEVAAFQKQMAISPTDTDHYEKALASHYRLGITIAQARKLLYEGR